MNDQGTVQILNNVMISYMKEIANQNSLAQAIVKDAQELRDKTVDKLEKANETLRKAIEAERANEKLMREMQQMLFDGVMGLTLRVENLEKERRNDDG